MTTNNQVPWGLLYFAVTLTADEARAQQRRDAEAARQQEFQLWAYANPKAYERWKADQALQSTAAHRERIINHCTQAVVKFRRLSAARAKREEDFPGFCRNFKAGRKPLTVSELWWALHFGIVTWEQAQAEGMVPDDYGAYRPA